MSEAFQALQEEPQTNFSPSPLNPAERQHLRRIKISKTTGHTPNTSTGKFTPVYYLAGDERAAAELFVEENRAQLEALADELTGHGHNVISTSVDREVFDWILHALGLREIEKYETVVIEWRPDDEQTWCIGRRLYETKPNRRYSTKHAGRVDGTLTALYERLRDKDNLIIESALAAQSGVEGEVRQILDAFRQADRFPVIPTQADDELAVKLQGPVVSEEMPSQESESAPKSA